MNIIVGLTGGIASGKSTVSKMLAELGAIIIDADLIARKVVDKGSPALEEIKDYFGAEYVQEDGQLNRKKLGALVFKDKMALSRLNEITHPRIIEKIKKEINCHKKNSPNTVIIVDAALLIEMHLIDLVEEVCLVDIPAHLQQERLMKRNGLTHEEAEKRIASQMGLEEKKKYAHRIVDNSLDLMALGESVQKLWNEMKNKLDS